MDNENTYEKIISVNEEKFYDVRLVVSEFRDEYYLGIRKYFLSFDEGYIPSKEGISMKYEMDSSLALLEGLLEIIPLGECRKILENKLAEVESE